MKDIFSNQEPSKNVRLSEDILVIVSIIGIWPLIANKYGWQWYLLEALAILVLITILIRRVKRYRKTIEEI